MQLPNGFAKLDRTILVSTVWAGQGLDVRCTWVTLLALMDADGNVWATPAGIAVHAGVSVDRCREILAQFEAPDPESRSQAHEGRRIVKIERGYCVLNAREYRYSQTPEQARKARAMRAYREKLREAD